MRKEIQFIAVVILSALAVHAQNPHVNPDRGMKLGNAHALGDFETINTTNGNLMLKIPLAGLPVGRGSASSGIYLTYNSKLYNMRTEKLPDYRYFDAYYDRTVIEPDLNKGGWQLTGGYSLEVESRFRTPEPNCTVSHSELNDQIVYSNKLKVVFPDGSSHEMIPLGHKDVLGDRFFNITMDGLVRSCISMPTYTSRPVYYSRDGSFLRLETTTQGWTLFFPDGGKVVNGSQIYDRNGNFVTHAYGSLSDEFGRSAVTSNEDGFQVFRSKGIDGADIVWKVKWKTIYVSKTYTACEHHQCPSDEFPFPNFVDLLGTTYQVVDKIIQPEQFGGGEYVFTYNVPDFDPEEIEPTYGWGELSGIQMPTGAKVEYAYLMDGEVGTNFNTKDILKNFPTTKTLKYDLEYDGQVIDDGAVETWSYAVGWDGSSVTGPDGSTTTVFFGITDVSSGNLPWNSGLSLKTYSPDGTKVENIWERNVPTACNSASTCPDGTYGSHADNPYIKTEFTSIKSGSNYTLTTIKDYTYDKNGNVTEVREYDWMPYGDVPRSGSGEGSFPTGIPSGAASYLKRITKTEYYNDTPASSSTTYTDPDSYYLSSNKRLLRLAKSVTVQDASAVTKSRSEFTYDHTNYDSSNTVAGNATRVRTWDSTMNTVTNPLTDGNSVKTQTAYNAHGMPTLVTDANNVTTQITYGNITTSTGVITDLYPTQTITAYNTAVARTSTATYDFFTGAVTSATDEDNDVTVVTEYDDLGRPVKVRNAAGTGLESWVVTEYNDALRRVIVKADLETIGDGKKVAIQHFDQLGRVRLSRTLENAATEDPANEQHGIKVQTRYKTVSGYTYQLKSNPYRADYPANETDPTMGWTLATAWSDGKRSEVQTFAGAGLPTVFGGGNTNSTGIVRTDIDAERTLVTDQAGKRRISKTNALGQLKEVWEVLAASETGSESVAFPNMSIAHGFKTTYGYDTLNNLTTVTQGSQTPRGFTYSSLSRLLSASNPESGAISYGYDSNGNLTSKTDARTISTAYTYDALNRVTQRSYSGESGYTTPTVTYTYDNKTNAYGKLTKVSSTISTTEYTAFDILGRVTAHKQTTDSNDYTTGYTYSLSGQLLEQEYPGGRIVKNTYDAADGSISQVQSKRSAETYRNFANGFIYNAAGAVIAMRLGNGKWENPVFNSRMQPTKIGLGTGVASQDLLKLEYSYGTTANNGNVMEQKITVPGMTHPFIQAYTYDELNRITTAEETKNSSQEWKQTFTYDRYGNRNFNTSGGNTTTLPPSFDADIYNPSISTANNRFSSGQGYSYDSAGNTTADAEGRTFVYDAENKQIEVLESSATVGEYFYDGDGKRVKKEIPGGETTVFVYDAGGKLIQEHSTMVQTGGNAKTVFTTNDSLGSSRINSDGFGAVVSRHDYHPFGEEVARSGYGSDTIRRQFTGYERDGETGLDFAQARMYANQFGRFTSPDPIIMENRRLVDPQAINLYAYVRNNTLKYVDPDGEKFKGTDGEEVEIVREKVNGKKMWVIKSNNASADLTKLVGLINNSGSRTASKMLGNLNRHETMINLEIDSKTSRSDKELQPNGTTTVGLHEAHDKNGPVHFNDQTDKFDGKADISSKNSSAYREATITLYEKKMRELGYSGQALDGYLVGTFGHEARHDLDPMQVKAGTTGTGSDAVWHPQQNGKPKRDSPGYIKEKIIREVERSKGITIRP